MAGNGSGVSLCSTKNEVCREWKQKIRQAFPEAELDALVAEGCRASDESGIFTLYHAGIWAKPGISREAAEVKLGMVIHG